MRRCHSCQAVAERYMLPECHQLHIAPYRQLQASADGPLVAVACRSVLRRSVAHTVIAQRKLQRCDCCAPQNVAPILLLREMSFFE
jgi:hypothetical protein